MLKIGVYGDPHAGYTGDQGGVPSAEIHEAIVARLLEAKVHTAIVLGDLVHNQADDPWPEFDRIVSPLAEKASLRPVHGNHETEAEYLAYWTGRLPQNGASPTTYWINEGIMGFVGLNVYNAAESPPGCTDYSAQTNLVSSVFSTLKNKRLKIAAFHRPPYTTGARGADVCARVFDAVFKRTGVDIVLCGHIHAYEHFTLNGVHYIVTGGAGGFPHALNATPQTKPGLERVAAFEGYNYGVIDLNTTPQTAKIGVTFYDLNGNVIDQFLIEKSMAKRSMPHGPTPTDGGA